MMKYTSADLGDYVRATVAAYRATKTLSSKVYVILSGFASVERLGWTEADAKPTRDREHRYLVQRVYVGEHKGLGGRCAVIVGRDLREPSLGTTALGTPELRSFEVRVQETPPDGVDQPFEGAYAMAQLALEPAKK